MSTLTYSQPQQIEVAILRYSLTGGSNVRNSKIAQDTRDLELHINSGGYLPPLLIAGENAIGVAPYTVIAGNRRTKALLACGVKFASCIIVSGFSQPEYDRLVLDQNELRLTPYECWRFCLKRLGYMSASQLRQYHYMELAGITESQSRAAGIRAKELDALKITDEAERNKALEAISKEIDSWLRQSTQTLERVWYLDDPIVRESFDEFQRRKSGDGTHDRPVLSVTQLGELWKLAQTACGTVKGKKKLRGKVQETYTSCKASGAPLPWFSPTSQYSYYRDTYLSGKDPNDTSDEKSDTPPTVTSTLKDRVDSLKKATPVIGAYLSDDSASVQSLEKIERVYSLGERVEYLREVTPIGVAVPYDVINWLFVDDWTKANLCELLRFHGITPVDVDEQPVDEQPVDEQPVDEQPVDEQPVDEVTEPEPMPEEPTTKKGKKVKV